MKKLCSSAWHCKGKIIALRHQQYGILRNTPLFFCSLILMGLLFTGCQKDTMNATADEMQTVSSNAVITETNALDRYTGLSAQTLWQLQQARAASARYLHLSNALADGYADINVIVPGMGYHYLKAANLDINFDPRKPELLVYNRLEDGSMRLVAVEYAVPINLTPDTAPEGFAGTDDEWDRNSTFGLWLLHAWVWAYNPDGVFNPTNPSVHVH